MGRYWVVLGVEVQDFKVFTSCWGWILEGRMRCDLKTIICLGCYNDITWHQFTTQLHLTPSPNSTHISRQGGPNFIASNLVDNFYLPTMTNRIFYPSHTSYPSISIHTIFQFFSPLYRNFSPTQTLHFLLNLCLRSANPHDSIYGNMPYCCCYIHWWICFAIIGRLVPKLFKPLAMFLSHKSR